MPENENVIPISRGRKRPPISRVNRHARITIPTNFYPITLDEIEFREHYPDLDRDRIISDFVNHHLEKGETSTNWDARFIGFCNHRQGQANDLRRHDRTTDSMGFSTQPGGSSLSGSEGDYGRRFLAAYQKGINAGLSPNDARDAAERELEGTDG